MADAEAYFRKIEETYKIPPKVTDYLLKELQLETEADFVHLFSSQHDVSDSFVNEIKDLDSKALARTRLRQAWAGIKAESERRETARKRGEESEDMDALLPQPQLDTLAQRFWARYHLRFPPAVEPSDLLVSRLHKELATRLSTTA